VDGPFHHGERELQRRAGVAEAARAVGRSIGRRIPAGAGAFLARQRFAVASSLDAEGRVCASPVTGPAGFAGVVDSGMLRLAAPPIPGDPLGRNLALRPELGLLLLDPRTRQRMRFNGRGLCAPEGIFLLVEQAYGNCPKYIQRREALPDGAARAGRALVSKALSAAQQAWIRRADTFFIASFHPEGGADASHRGGFPGFVRIEAANRLCFDDYPGNAMFNTLGNLAGYPSCGLLFVDFEQGDVLQLGGRAHVGSDFAVRFEVDSVREARGAVPLRFRLLEYSRANPPLSRRAADGISST
jgi:hypothetical protein